MRGVCAACYALAAKDINAVANKSTNAARILMVAII
jgi:hypothetical protein